MKGFLLAAHRIVRCNPWGGHGHDPPLWYGETPAIADEEEREELTPPSNEPESR